MGEMTEAQKYTCYKICNAIHHYDVKARESEKKKISRFTKAQAWKYIHDRADVLETLKAQKRFAEVIWGGTATARRSSRVYMPDDYADECGLDASMFY